MGYALPKLSGFARRGAGALIASICLLGLVPTTPARAEAVFSGACTLTVTATFSPRLTPTLSSRSALLGGGGTCIVNGTIAPLHFSATVATTPATGGFGCVAGVMTGTGVVDIETPGFPGPLVLVQIVNAGGVLTMALESLLLAFEGVAEMAPDPGAVVSCATGSLSTGTWTGGLAFQDPYPPPA